MQTPRYATIFDTVQAGYFPVRPWILSLIALAVVGVGMLLIRRGGDARNDPWSDRNLGIMLVTLGPMVLLIFAVVTYGATDELTGKLRRGEYTKVEGTIEDFVPGDPCCNRGRRPEQFRVGTHRYHYTPGSLDAGFTQTAGAGGPLRAGLRVRITDVGGHIARLEIAQ